MRRRALRRVALAFLVCGATLGLRLAAAVEPRPAVPVDGPVNVDTLLQVVRIRQAMMARVFYDYSFRQTTRSETLDRSGAVKRHQTEVYRVVPSPTGIERHLVERDGTEPPARLVRKQEKRNEKLKVRWAKIAAKQPRPVRPTPARAPAKPATPARHVEPARPAATSAAAGPATGAPPNGAAPTAVRSSSPPQASAGATFPQAEAAPLTASGTPPSTAPGSSPPPSVAPTAPTPPAAVVPTPPSASIADGAMPVCVLGNLLSSVRPPLPGSVVHASHPGPTASPETRRARDNAGDYSLLELLSLTDHEYAGTCLLDGRVAHVLSFTPPTTFDALNPVERVVTAMRGTILIDAKDLQVIRAEGGTIAPITWGGGLVKLRSAHVVLENTKVGGELWVPSLDVFEFDSRVVFDDDRERVTHAFDDYRKATVTTQDELIGIVPDAPAAGTSR